MKRLACVVMLLVTCSAFAARPNVLFIAVDDLRPELGCYGKSQIISPHIDALAARGVRFDRAYCQMAVCSPSRTSLLTGLRPDSTKIYDLQTHFRKFVPEVVTLPQHFKLSGYHTQALGKIFHGAFAQAYVGSKLDDPPSWSVPTWRGSPRYYWTPEGVAEARRVYGKKYKKKDDELDDWVDAFVQALPTEAPDISDDVPYDGQLALEAVKTLREVAAGEQPFFLAVGFLKPHLPFVAPKRYWDLYDPAKLPLSPTEKPPAGAPPFAILGDELASYSSYQRKMTADQQRHLLHGYDAAVSYVDAQVGRVLDELDRLKLTDRTIVVLWGDHGWHLGDEGHWGKATNYEVATRAPLIVAGPGVAAAGRSSAALVEFVDIYPTLCAMAGLEAPPHLEGTSFAPLLGDPGKKWKTAAFSQYPRAVGGKTVMGYAMRTDRYRFVQWLRPDGSSEAVELYDHQTDPEETVNIAGRADVADTVKQLDAQLRAGWRGAVPGKE